MPVTPETIAFRPLAEADFPLLHRWLAEPHVRAFYQKTAVTLAEVADEYGPAVRGEEPTYCHLALDRDTPFGYLQCYRNVSYAPWAQLIGTTAGISVDLYLGEPGYLRRGYGRAMLDGYLKRVALPLFPGETEAYIAHAMTNTAALRCSQAIGFRPLRQFVEDGKEMRLLVRP